MNFGSLNASFLACAVSFQLRETRLIAPESCRWIDVLVCNSTKLAVGVGTELRLPRGQLGALVVTEQASQQEGPTPRSRHSARRSRFESTDCKRVDSFSWIWKIKSTTHRKPHPSATGTSGANIGPRVREVRGHPFQRSVGRVARRSSKPPSHRANVAAPQGKDVSVLCFRECSCQSLPLAEER